jgi:hypothetical protein
MMAKVGTCATPLQVYQRDIYLVPRNPALAESMLSIAIRSSYPVAFVGRWSALDRPSPTPKLDSRFGGAG